MCFIRLILWRPPVFAPLPPGRREVTQLQRVGRVLPAGSGSVPLSWTGVDTLLTGYNVYYDQSGKLQSVATVPAGTTSYTDRQLKQKTQYCYVVTAVNACGDVVKESGPSNKACATTK